MNDHLKRFVIVTGASSGVGLYATQSLIQRGWHVVMACRDLPKAARVASEMGLDPAQFTIMQLLQILKLGVITKIYQLLELITCRFLNN